MRLYSPTAVSVAVSVPEPTYFWKMEESSGAISEEQGTGKTLTTFPSFNAVQYQQTGKVDFCCGCVTANNRSHGNTSITQNATLTIGIWLRRLTGGTLGGIPLRMYGGSGAGGLWIYAGEGVGSPYVFSTKRYYTDGVSQEFKISGTTADYSDESWHHVVITHDDSTGTLQLFVNGDLENSGTIPVYDALDFDNSELRIGTASGATGMLWDEVKIWLGTILTAPEVAADYATY